MSAQQTALQADHTELGARFTEFGGWEMPVRYGSIIDEHRAVRQAAGLFDLRNAGSEAKSGLCSHQLDPFGEELGVRICFCVNVHHG